MFSLSSLHKIQHSHITVSASSLFFMFLLSILHQIKHSHNKGDTSSSLFILRSLIIQFRFGGLFPKMLFNKSVKVLKSFMIKLKLKLNAKILKYISEASL